MEILSQKIVFLHYDTEASPNAKSVAFWAIFSCILIFCPSSLLSSLTAPLQFEPAPPLLQGGKQET